MQLLNASFLAALLFLFLPCAVTAEGGKDPVFLVVNGSEYRAGDFLSWWENWREEGAVLPERPDPFVDWLLLADDAEAMQLDTEPSFQRKVRVFLRSRGLMLLKQEEVDDRVDVSEKALRAAYEQRHGKAREGSDAQDFAAQRPTLEKKLRKEQEDSLTAALVERLRRKYGVRVDETLLRGLDLDAPDPALLDKALFTSEKGPAPVGDFTRFCQKDAELRKALKEEPNERKRRVLADFIGQIVTMWEAEDRHYEERPPLRDAYRFYRRHRLIKELEAKLFAPEATVNDSEIAAYYETHREQFTRPETVRLAVLEDLSGEGERIWAETMAGTHFFAAVKKHLGKDAPVRTVPSEHLEPTTAEVVRKLAKGETSKPFTVGGRETLLYLADRTPATPIPLDQIKGDIGKQLSGERLARLRADYVARLRERSRIQVDDQAWAETLTAARKEKP